MNTTVRRLGNYVRIKTGKLDANASDPYGAYPFFTCSQEPLRIASFSYDCECVLVAGNGDLNVKYYDGKFDAYQRTYIIESIDKMKLDPRYLFHFMSVYVEKLRVMSIGGVIKYIKLGYLTEAQIPLPPLAEQRRIAESLDRAEAFRTKRRAVLAHIDTLTQSIFLDLFGDPATNPKKWPKSAFESITSRTRTGLKRGPFGGALKKEIFVEAGYKVYEQQHAIYKDHESGKYFITERKYREMEAFAIEPGDFIVSCSGTVGRIYRLPPCAPKGVINQALLRVTLDEERIEPTFFEALFESDEFQGSLIGNARGTGINNFPPMERIRAIAIILPPLGLQRSFSRRVAAVEKLKAAHRASLAELDTLFTSLQHRAFRGEL